MRRSDSSRENAGVTNKNTSLVTGLGMDTLVPNLHQERNEITDGLSGLSGP